ncbi:hypothetical protein [Thiocystis violacea]|uniref:hypothetical protein n=1 Tax=Thiocystis violacea TaxID=13725 RepID=UPI001906CDCD|nr:hypothetical protein [Thiocystis violacea]
MTTPRIVLHIGLEKTGTTSIQRFLTTNRARLLARHGILYPTAPELFRHETHSVVAAALLGSGAQDFVTGGDTPRLDRVIAAIDDAADTYAEQIVLSSEHFSSRLTPEAITRLAQCLAPFPVEVLVYLRPQDEMVLSAFSTRLLCGGREWMRPRGVGPHLRYFNYLQLLVPWADAFGYERIRVRLFDRTHMQDGDVVTDFLATLGVRNSGLFKQSPPLNRSLNVAEAELMRRLNQRLPTWEEASRRRRPQIYHRAQRVRRTLLAETRAARMFEHSPPLSTLLSSTERQQLLDRFSDVNTRLARDFLSRGTLFKEPSTCADRSEAADTRAAWSPDEALLAEVMASFEQRLRPRRPIPLGRALVRKAVSLLGYRQPALPEQSG